MCPPEGPPRFPPKSHGSPCRHLADTPALSQRFSLKPGAAPSEAPWCSPTEPWCCGTPVFPTLAPGPALGSPRGWPSAPVDSPGQAPAPLQPWGVSHLRPNPAVPAWDPAGGGSSHHGPEKHWPHNSPTPYKPAPVGIPTARASTCGAPISPSPVEAGTVPPRCPQQPVCDPQQASVPKQCPLGATPGRLLVPPPCCYFLISKVILCWKHVT